MSIKNPLDNLKEKYATPQSMLLMLKMHQYVNTNLAEITKGFIASLQEYSQTIQHNQQNQGKNKIAYIHFSLLRTLLLEKDYRLRIDAYDHTYYRDKNQCIGYCNIGWALQYYEEYQAFLETHRRPHIGKHQLLDLTEDELSKYILYISRVIRKMLRAPEAQALLNEIAKEPVFVIRVGEYLDKSDIVYKLDQTPKDSADIKTQLENSRQLQFIYQIVPGLDLSQGNYRDKNFSFSDLSNCNLANSDLQNTVMENTNLTGANLTGVDFSQAVSLDTDYSNAIITGSKFTNALLINPKFQNAKIHQSDFREAALINPDFTGATVTQTRFLPT